MTDNVQQYYDRNASVEHNRLLASLSKIEFESTKHLIKKYFPKKGEVLDIGAATGRYSIELIKRGLSVTLVDISNEELNIAKEEIQSQGLKANAFYNIDARNLAIFENSSFNAILLMGPMYHVIKKSERIQILRTTKSILKKNGIALIAYLNSWGILRTGIREFPNWYRDIKFLRSMINEKSFTANEMKGFTQCHWSTPTKARAEIEESGFEVITYIGAEGFMGGLGEEFVQLIKNDSRIAENVMIVSAEMSELPQFRDTTDHLHFVVRNSK